MKEEIKTQRAFIQIPLLIAIIVSIVIVSTATTGVVLHKQGKLAPFIANVSQVFRGIKEIEPEIKSEEPQLEEEQGLADEGEGEPLKPLEGLNEKQKEISQTEQELEQAKLEAEKAKQEAEKAKAGAERLEAEQEFQEQLKFESEKREELEIKSCSSGLVLCNGKCWKQCSSGKTFHCPKKGDPFCCSGIVLNDECCGGVVCNNGCWNPSCPTGYKFYCPSGGGDAYCKEDESFAKKQQEEKMNKTLSALQEYIDQRFQERKTRTDELIAGLNEIFDKYQDQLDQLWAEIDELAESPAYKKCGRGHLCIGGELQEWYSVLAEIDLKNNEIAKLQGERKLELQSYYPAGNWFQPGDTLPPVKLFDETIPNYITIETPYGSTDFSVVPKSGGGYYLRDLSTEVTFEVTPMFGGGGYYVNY